MLARHLAYDRFDEVRTIIERSRNVFPDDNKKDADRTFEELDRFRAKGEALAAGGCAGSQARQSISGIVCGVTSH